MDFSYSRDFLSLIDRGNDLQKLLRESSFKASNDLNEWESKRAFITQAINADGTILDIGCANGFLLRCLQEWSPYHLDPYGIDANKRVLEKAQHLFYRAPHHFVQSKLEHLDELHEKHGWPEQFNFIYWNVWDNWLIDKKDQLDIVEHVLMPKVAPYGRLIMGFYSDKEEANTKKIENLEKDWLPPSGKIKNNTGPEQLVWYTKEH